jgi:hypothetical protein
MGNDNFTGGQDMVAQPLTRHRDLIVVRPEGASIFGISGHKIGELEGEAPVTVYGEHGPYTIVSCHGLSGYVLTERLGYVSELEEEAAALEPVPEPEPETGGGNLRAAVLRVSLGVAVIGSGVAVALGLI